MQDLLEQFQARRQVFFPAGSKRPNRYPEELRRLAVDYARQASRAGLRVSRIAAALKIDGVTLRSWCPDLAKQRVKRTASPRANAMERVEIVDALAPSDSVSKGLTLVGPRGVRVEGLDFEQVIALVERLAC